MSLLASTVALYGILTPLIQDYASNAWAVLKCFGYHEALKTLNGSGVHRLENVLSLSHDMHNSFDKLLLWLEPIVSNTSLSVHIICSTHFSQRMTTQTLIVTGLACPQTLKIYCVPCQEKSNSGITRRHPSQCHQSSF
jgi:hypothetical protein